MKRIVQQQSSANTCLILLGKTFIFMMNNSWEMNIQGTILINRIIVQALLTSVFL